MALMTWNDDLLTGIDIVDRQHRGLVDLVNEAAPILARANEVKPETIQPLLDRLFDYAAVHFKTEEDLMAATGIDARVLAHHQATHGRFVSQISAMAAHLTQGGKVSGEQLLSFLSGWLVLHILGEDQTMARQIKAVETGSPPEEAYDKAAGARITPSPRALTHALVYLYTQLHRQNHELDMHRNALQQLVHERTAALENTTQELRQSRDAAVAGSLAKGRFLGIMSHELRTPMNSILAYSQMMIKEPSLPKMQSMARKIVASSGHLLELISDVIDYSSLDAGHDELEVTSFELATLLRQSCGKAFDLGRNKGLAIRQEIDPALPAFLKGSAKHIASVLRHFANNAVKFTEQGGIDLRVELQPARKTTGNPASVMRVRFTVSDSGIGITPENQSHLFEAFSQLDDRPNRNYEGIGMGLALVRQLASLLNAEVGLRSQPDQGTSFWFELDFLPVDAALDEAALLETAHQPLSSAVSDNNPASPVAPATETPTRAPIKCDTTEVLNELAHLLSQYDSRCGEIIEQNSACLRRVLGEDHRRLVQQIAAFDYDDALITVRNHLHTRQPAVHGVERT